MPRTKVTKAKNKKKHLAIGVACFFLAAFVILATSGIALMETRPLYISGDLIGPNEQPVPNGDYTMQMRLVNLDTGNVVYEKDNDISVKNGAFRTGINPSDSALANRVALIMCLLGQQDQPNDQPARILPGCRTTARRTVGLVCAPYLLRANMLGWKSLLNNDNSIKDMRPCHPDGTATVNEKLNLEHLVAEGVITPEQATNLQNHLTQKPEQQ